MVTTPARLETIDVCLVATRRPSLLEQTLRSFHDGLFRHFTVRRIVSGQSHWTDNAAA